ncbi:MAG: hypothetical protein ACPGO3_00260 [Magnetospiraceae bacterium]
MNAPLKFVIAAHGKEYDLTLIAKKEMGPQDILFFEDADGDMHLAYQMVDGAFCHCFGPLKFDVVLGMAEKVISGIPWHRSETELVRSLALAVLVQDFKKGGGGS